MSEIARAAAELGIDPKHVELCGDHAAKIHLDTLERAVDPGRRLVLVTGVTPTPAGEGKTTVAIALADAIRARGATSAVCLRQSSLGPALGAKGGGAGGGRARVVPLDRSILHLTGDFHAVGQAHNTLAAMLDNAWHHDQITLDPLRPAIDRVVDINDRFLRNLDVGYGAKARQSGFSVTASSEVMAILALLDGANEVQVLAELRRRLGQMVLGFRPSGAPITADEIGAGGVAAAIMREACKPNLLRTAAGTPAFLHSGPFANIAHGCSSILADRVAERGAEVVVTEAGFGTDVGAEKFFDIKARRSGWFPDSVVVVATVRSIVAQGSGVLEAGLPAFERHLSNVAAFGVGAVVAINVFPGDSPAQHAAILACAERRGVAGCTVDAFRSGADGAVALADLVSVESAGAPRSPRPLYQPSGSIGTSVQAIGQAMYGSEGIDPSPQAAQEIAELEALGFGELPVCVAKTPFSLSTDAAVRGLPDPFPIPISRARVQAGAGFVYVLTGKTLTMPGLGATPRAVEVDLDPTGSIAGLE